MTLDITTAPSADDIRSDRLALLRAKLTGTLALPGDDDWDDARRAWSLAVDQRPEAVAHPVDADDVQAIVRTAAELGLGVTAQGTGHNAAPLGSLAGTILIRTDRMRGVEIDAVAMTARVEAGAWWADVTAAAAPHGLVGLAGTAADVGVVGYTLGGGLSWLGRSHGLAANSVTAIEVVTADGVLRRVDDQHEPELFWALRGGGGSFGVVTALEFRLYRLATVEGGAFWWPLADAGRVLHAWRTWCETLPPSVTTIARVMRIPDAPGVPPHLAGRECTVVEVVAQETVEEAARLVAPLRALAPELDMFGSMPASALSQIHGDPEGPVPAAGDGMMLRDLPADAIDAFVAFAESADAAPLMSIEFRLLGAELAPGRGEGGVVADFDGGFIVFSGGMTVSPEHAALVTGALDALAGVLEPWTADTVYLNFAERPVAAEALFGDRLARLRRVKTAYDPQGRIRGNHPVRPLGDREAS